MVTRWPRTRSQHGRRPAPKWRASAQAMAEIVAKRDAMCREAAIRGFVGAMRRSAAYSKELRDVEHRIRAERRRIEGWAWISGPPESDELARLRSARKRLEDLEELWSLCAETARVRAMEFGAASQECDDAWSRGDFQEVAAVVPLQGL